jgi:hypothetical protein
MLKLKFKRSYRAQSGKTVFVYLVSGKAADVEAYNNSCGDYLRTDDVTGQSLHFASSFAGNEATLVPNQEGDRYYIDRSEDDKVNSLIEQHAGTALGAALAQAKAAELLAAMRSKGSVSAPVAKVEAKVEESAPENLDGL